MTDGVSATRGAWWSTLTITCAAAVLTFWAGRLMFSTFMFYDDEGYVLISLRNFAEHGGLYRDVYSQYGPFPFAVYLGLHKLGLPFTHLAGRLVTLAAWVGVALCCAALVRSATRSLVATVAVIAAAFPYLWVMISEPAHPGGLIAFFTAAAAAIGYRAIVDRSMSAWAVAIGAIAAAMALTKINVGGLVVLAGLAWMLLHHRSDFVRRWAPAAVALGGVLVPLVLMRPVLNLEWVQTYAAIFACSTVAAALASSRAATPLAGWRTLAGCVGAGSIVAAAVLMVIFLRGTSPGDALEGMLLGPVRHPVAFNLPYTWAAGARTLAFLSALTCAIAFLQHRRRTLLVDTSVAALRLVATAGLALAVLRFPDGSPDRLVFGYGAPCLWLFLWPLPDENRAAKPALTWVGLLWLGQFLHAFPVAGSQIAWGTFLALPLGAIGAHDAARWLASRYQRTNHRRRSIKLLVLRLLVTGVAIAIGWRFIRTADRYRDGSDLQLPGAELLRLPSDTVALFRVLALNATAHADRLLSEPGMFSFNLWTGLPTPTLANVTHWFSLLSPSHQRAIISALEAHPRACVIVQRKHIEYLEQRSLPPAGELHDYIASNFSPAFSLDGFEFCVRNGRRIEPLMLGEMLVYSDAAATPNEENTALKMRLLLPPGRAVARVELTAAHSPRSPPMIFDSSNSRVEITPAKLHGAPRPLPEPAAWPFTLEGGATVTIHFNRFAHPRPIAGSLITLRGADNSEVALARMKE